MSLAVASCRNTWRGRRGGHAVSTAGHGEGETHNEGTRQDERRGSHPTHGGTKGLGQAPEAAEILLETAKLEGGRLVEAAALLADVHLLLPQVGAGDEEKVAEQELDRLRKGRGGGKGERGDLGELERGGRTDGQTDGRGVGGGRGGPCGQASLRGAPAGLHGRGIALPV